MIDIRQTVGWTKYFRSKGWLSDEVRSADGKHKLKVLIFRFGWWPWKMLKLQRHNFDPDFEDLRRLKKKHHVIQTVIEPLVIQKKNIYKKYGFRSTVMPYLPLVTVLVDLKKSKEKLWKELSENARRLIKKNKNVKIETVTAEKFYPLWKANAKVWIITLGELKSLLKSFEDKVSLVVSHDNRGYHSGLIVINTADTANYFQTWTSDLGRKSGAHYKLVWEEILKAKKKGLKLFDLEGIFDNEHPIKRWKGFTEFKKKFGGDVVRHPGSFSKWF